VIILLLSCTSEVLKEQLIEYDGDGLVMAMVAFDYSVGSLAYFDLETSSITEDIASISGDPVLVYDANAIWQLNRFQYDTLRKYSPTDLRAPLKEVSLATDVGSSNPHDAEVCNENLFVSLYGTDSLAVLNPETLESKTRIALLDWADDDGIPEVSSLVQWNESVFVGLQRLDRNSDFEPQSSMVLQIDCSSYEIINHWEMGTNISLVEWDDGVALVSQKSEAEDAKIFQWDSTEESWQSIWVSDTSFSSVQLTGDRLFYSSLSSDMSYYQLHCINLANSEHIISSNLNMYVTDLWLQDTEVGWVATHWGWMELNDDQPGISKVDLHSCSVLEHWNTQLAPYSIAFVPSE
jgi:hypothetical protein